jgi:hypothetical protein
MNCTDEIGTTFEIQWTPTNTTEVVSLDLGTGPSNDVEIVLSIAANIPNTGVIQIQVSNADCNRVSNGLFLIKFLVETIIQLKSPRGKFFSQAVSNEFSPNDYNFTPRVSFLIPRKY